MSILIKNMRMPETCGDCPLQHSEYLECKITHRITWGWADGGGTRTLSPAENDCPLAELPPHGRLIDADALKDTLDYYIREAGWSDEINEALTWVRDEFIDHEPTIIEAEEGNT